MSDSQVHFILRHLFSIRMYYCHFQIFFLSAQLCEPLLWMHLLWNIFLFSPLCAKDTTHLSLHKTIFERVKFCHTNLWNKLLSRKKYYSVWNVTASEALLVSYTTTYSMRRISQYLHSLTNCWRGCHQSVACECAKLVIVNLFANAPTANIGRCDISV